MGVRGSEGEKDAKLSEAVAEGTSEEKKEIHEEEKREDEEKVDKVG